MLLKMSPSRVLLLTLAVFHGAEAETENQAPFYTASDDASWAIQSGDLSSVLGEDKQVLYDSFIKDCNEG